MTTPRAESAGKTRTGEPAAVATEFDSSRPARHRAHERYEVAGDHEALLLVSSWRTPDSLRPSVATFFRRTFLPSGYPSSVRKEYLEYQTWDTIQALCSYLRGVLCLTATLHASGVGDEHASALAAAMIWVLRDGFGMVGSLVFSYAVSSHMDSNIKEWRLFADVANDVGLTLDLLAPFFRNHFALVSSLATVCKALCGVAAGCTKTSITSHFALRANTADIAAKENAQETAVNVIGMFLGVKVASYLGDSPLIVWAIFTALSLLHVYANYRCVSALHLNTLNKQRTMCLVRLFMGGKQEDMCPECVSRQERMWMPVRLWWSYKLLGGRLASLAQDRTSLLQLRSTFTKERFLIGLSTCGRLGVVLDPAASADDMLKAYFICVVFWEKVAGAQGMDVTGEGGRERCLPLVEEAYRYSEAYFSDFVAHLKMYNWDVDHPQLSFGPWRCEWNVDKLGKDE